MIVYIIIAVTVALSMVCFKQRPLFFKLSLSPYNVVQKNEWFRLLTHGFIHGSTTHLLINMLVFWSFASSVFFTFSRVFSSPIALFLLLYLGAIVVSGVVDVVMHKKNYYYNSIGASGGVMAVVFASILFNPLNKIYFFAIVPIPAILFGVLYLWYESYQSKRIGDHVNHTAHIVGAIYGFFMPIVVEPWLLQHFFSSLGALFNR